MNTSPVEMLVIMPHPDDAEIGMGGTIAKTIKQGNRVVYIVVTSGEKGTEDITVTSEKIINTREYEQRAAASILGVSEVHFLHFPDGLLEDNYGFRLAVTREIRRFRPKIIATTDPYRRYIWHRDHRITGQVVADAVYPFARNYPAFPELIGEQLEPHTVREMLFWGSDEPNYYVDITDTFQLKIRALKCHQTQLGSDETNRIENWARQRAQNMASKQDFELAEAFHRVEIFW